MKKGPIIVIVNIVIGLCSFGAWVLDNSNFAITSGIALITIPLIMFGLMLYYYEVINLEEG